MKYSLVAILLLSLAGCELLGDAEPLPVQFDVDAALYQPGQEVVLTLTNTARRTFTVSPTLCPAVLQQRDQSSWKPIPLDATCLAIGHELRSGNKLVAPRRLPETLTPGTYRFLYVLNDSEGVERYRRFEQIEVYTQVFRVES